MNYMPLALILFLAAAAVISFLLLTASMADADRAAAGPASSPAIPPWLSYTFEYYAAGAISDADLLAALEYLINEGYIKLDLPEPVISAEALYWNTVADATEDAMHETELGRIELSASIPLYTSYMNDRTAAAWEEAADEALMLVDESQRTSAVFITEIRTATADGSVSDSEEDDIYDAEQSMITAGNEAGAALYDLYDLGTAGTLGRLFTDAWSSYQ